MLSFHSFFFSSVLQSFTISLSGILLSFYPFSFIILSIELTCKHSWFFIFFFFPFSILFLLPSLHSFHYSIFLFLPFFLPFVPLPLSSLCYSCLPYIHLLYFISSLFFPLSFLFFNPSFFSLPVAASSYQPLITASLHSAFTPNPHFTLPETWVKKY